MEAIAIRWHMAFDDAVRGGSYAIKGNAFDEYPLAVKLHLADTRPLAPGREQGTSSVNRR